MKKLIKKQRSLFGQKVIVTVDERLNQLNVETLAPEKLAEANKHLRKMKSLPKVK